MQFALSMSADLLKLKLIKKLGQHADYSYLTLAATSVNIIRIESNGAVEQVAREATRSERWYA